MILINIISRLRSNFLPLGKLEIYRDSAYAPLYNGDGRLALYFYVQCRVPIEPHQPAA